MAAPTRSRALTILSVIVIAIFTIGLPFLRWLASVWIDWLWFGDLGQRSVFVTRIVSQLVTGAIFAVATFFLLYVNLRLARRMAPRAMPISLPEGMPEQLELFIEALRGRFGPVLDRVVLWGCLALALGPFGKELEQHLGRVAHRRQGLADVVRHDADELLAVPFEAPKAR